MSLNLYDQACRYLVGFDGPGFLRWLLGLQSHEFAFNVWLDTRAILYPGERDRTGDLVAHLVDKAENDAPWAVLVEFQIEPDPDMFGRALRHLGSICQFARPGNKNHSRRFNVGAAVLNLTGRGNCSKAMRWPRAKLSTELFVAENNMEHEPASVLLDGVESGAWPRTLLPFTVRAADARRQRRWYHNSVDGPRQRRAEFLASFGLCRDRLDFRGSRQAAARLERQTQGVEHD